MLESQTLRGFLNQGLREGRLEALRQTLRKLLEKKFGALSPSVLERIEAAEATGLEPAILQVSDIESLDDLKL